MRLPPGFGSITKLKGRRRNPYIVRITTGYNDKGQQIFKRLGYVKNRKEGLELLNQYHKNPNSVTSEITFEDMYYKLIDMKQNEVGESSMKGYRAAFKAAEPLHKMKMTEIKTHHMQDIINNKDGSKSTKNSMRVTYTLMFDIALQNDLVDKNYAKFLKTGKTVKSEKKVFTDEEIDTLWKHQGDLCVDVTLILIYTGMRISELLEIEMKNIHLDEQYMIGGKKTDSGINRIIAISDKILPIIKRYYGDGTAKALLMNENVPYTYHAFTKIWKKKFKNELGMDHTLHETRHTATSLYYRNGAPMEVIRKQLGHSGVGVTEEVYLHVDLPLLLDMVNRV